MGKCEFIKKCKWYSKDSHTCNKDDGDYYGPGRSAGCKRIMEKKYKGIIKRYEVYKGKKKIDNVQYVTDYDISQEEAMKSIKKGYTIKEAEIIEDEKKPSVISEIAFTGAMTIALILFVPIISLVALVMWLAGKDFSWHEYDF